MWTLDEALDLCKQNGWSYEVIMGKEPQMTPNERLLKAANNLVNAWINNCESFSGPLSRELRDAVKACEAAGEPTHDIVPDTPIPTVVRCNDCPTEYLSMELYMDHVRECHIKRGPTLTDEQRRLGLRSTRHMGTDWGNYDYD